MDEERFFEMALDIGRFGNGGKLSTEMCQRLWY
jgi:hypothetical protein